MKTTKAGLQKQLNEIQKQIDNFKEEPKIEIGKWYTDNDSDSDFLMCVTKINGDEYFGYGFTGCSGYRNSDDNNSWGSISYDIKREATDKEVEEALIKEAKKRGFKKGVTVNQKTAYNGEGGSYEIGAQRYLYSPIAQNFSISGVGIFNNGKWAEIIEDEKPTICDYEMEVESEHVKFGCKKLHKEEVDLLYGLCKSLNVTSLTLDNGDYKFETDVLKEVLDYLNK